MEALRDHILAVTAAALICGVVSGLTGGKGPVRLLCGLILALAVLGPLGRVELTGLSGFSGAFTSQAQAAAEAGVDMASAALAAGIKERSEAYILNEAAALNAQVDADVTVERVGDAFVPTAVTLTGEITPYAKTRLGSLIEKDLGIAGEDQRWTWTP